MLRAPRLLALLLCACSSGAGGDLSDGGAAADGAPPVIERRCGPGDFLATIYHHLGIDASQTFITDFNGRPTPIVDHGRPIAELMRS